VIKLEILNKRNGYGTEDNKIKENEGRKIYEAELLKNAKEKGKLAGTDFLCALWHAFLVTICLVNSKLLHFLWQRT
jgi:hypothetical protein